MEHEACLISWTWLATTILELLRIITAWPVMIAVTLIWIIAKFQGALDHRIRTSTVSASYKDFAATVEPLQAPQRSAESTGTTPVVAPEGPPNTPEQNLGAASAQNGDKEKFAAKLGEELPELGADTTEELKAALAEATAQRDNLRNEAWFYFFQWLEAFLAPKTKSALYWVAESGLIDEGLFRSAVKNRALNAADAEAIESALHDQKLISRDGTNVRLGVNGEFYMGWRKDKSSRRRSPF